MDISKYKENNLFLNFNKSEDKNRNLKFFVDYFDCIKNKVYKNEITRLQFPLEIMIEITNSCNLSCKYCYKSELKYKDGDFINIDIIKAIANSIGIHGDTIVYLEGGEPFLHPQINEIMEVLKSYNIPVDILSNGTIMPDEFLEKFKDGFLNRIDDIQISLDGINDFNKSNRGIKSEEILKNIKKLNRYGINPRINCIVTKYNYKGIIELLKVLNSECNISIISFNTPIGKSNKELVLDDINAVKLFKDIKELSTKINFPIQGSVINLEYSCLEKQVRNEVHFRCTAMRSKMCISTNGDVYPCVFLENRMKPLGNINEKNISEIWNSEESSQYVSKIIKKNLKCINCNNSQLCTQYCAGMMI